MNTEDLKKQPKPSFKNPPIIEVIAGVQFENPLNFRTLDLADIWDDFGKDKFTDYREMRPLDPILPDNVRVIEMSDLPRMRRFWFETPNDEELIQVQQDRLVYNWKRPSDNLNDKNCYPRYEAVIENFFQYYESFSKGMERKGVKAENPSVMELTYVNLIDVPDGGVSEIGECFKDASWSNQKRVLPPPENIQHRNFFKIPDLPLMLFTDLSMRQRVHDGKIAFHYELSVRGPINNFSNKSMREWFDNARLWITFGFVDSTTECMHKIWEKEK